MTAEDNRRKMPTVAAFVDEVREFWPDARVIYASENGITLGKKPDLSSSIIAGDAWYVDKPRSRGSRK